VSQSLQLLLLRVCLSVMCVDGVVVCLARWWVVPEVFPCGVWMLVLVLALELVCAVGCK
jgi:hypothetical protein